MNKKETFSSPPFIPCLPSSPPDLWPFILPSLLLTLAGAAVEEDEEEASFSNFWSPSIHLNLKK